MKPARPVALAAVGVVATVAGALALGRTGPHTHAVATTAPPSSRPASTSSSIATTVTVHPATSSTHPVVVVDCGERDTLSGWPTTTWAPNAGACIAAAAASGTPARYDVVTGSSTNSASTTPDGYPIPARVITTFEVLARGDVRITRDDRASGGMLTVQHCVSLSETDGSLQIVGPCSTPQ